MVIKFQLSVTKHQINIRNVGRLLRKQFQNVVIEFVLNVVKHRLSVIVKNTSLIQLPCNHSVEVLCRIKSSPDELARFYCQKTM